jgi:hypothetical protein
MKFSTALAMSVALASTAQACVRILVNEVWGDTREITLWDQDQVSDLRLPFKETTGNDDIWQGNGYTVAIHKQTTGGSVSYPNGHCKSAIFAPLRVDGCPCFRAWRLSALCNTCADSVLSRSGWPLAAITQANYHRRRKDPGLLLPVGQLRLRQLCMRSSVGIAM